MGEIEVQKTPSKYRKTKGNSTTPKRSSFVLSSLASPTRKSVLSSVTNTFSPSCRPKTPPVICRAIEGLSFGNRAKSASSPRQSSSRSGASSYGEREPSNKGSEENGVFSWSDSQLAQQYNFEKEIGFGNWGSCWLAETRFNSPELPRGSKVAVKLVHRQETAPSNARVKALWNEYKVLRSCGLPLHKNLVQFKEFVITPSYALVVMDYYKQAMNVALPISTYAGSSGFFQQLLSSIQWLHGNNVTHCDIKVANLLVDTREDKIRGTPILVDFGFATLHDSKTNFMSKQSWGTPEYLSPERSRGELHDERLSDIWALGVTFFEIATGRTPFEHEDEQFLSKDQLEIYYQRTLDPKWVGTWSVPSDLESLCRLMLAPKPEDRIMATEALQHPFFTRSGSSIERRYGNYMENGNIMMDDELQERECLNGDSVVSQNESDSKISHSTKSGSLSFKTPLTASPRKQYQQTSESIRDALTLTQDKLLEATFNSTIRSPPHLPAKDIVQKQEFHGKENVCTEINEIHNQEGILYIHDPAPVTTTSDHIDSSISIQGWTSSSVCTSNVESQGYQQSGHSNFIPEDSEDYFTINEETPQRSNRVQRAEVASEHNSNGSRAATNSSKKQVNGDALSPKRELVKDRSYEIMADIRREDNEKESREEYGTEKDDRRSEKGRVKEVMESVASQVQNLQTQLFHGNPLHSPCQSRRHSKSAAPTDEKEDLVARLDEMGILAASLAKMVEETKSKLSRIQNASLPTSRKTSHSKDELENTFDPIRTPQRHIRQYSVTRVDPDQIRTPRQVCYSTSTSTNKQTPVVPSSSEIERTNTFQPDSLKRKISKTMPSLKGSTLSMPVPFPRGGLKSKGSTNSFFQGQSTGRGNEIHALNTGQSKLRLSPVLKKEKKEDATRDSLVHSGSIRGRALSHFLTKYGSRNNRTGDSPFTGNGEFGENYHSKINATLHDNSSSSPDYRGQRYLSGMRRTSNVSKVVQTPPYKVEALQRKPSQLFFDDDGVVNIGFSNEVPSVERLDANAIQVRSKQGVTPGSANRSLSRAHQFKAEIAKTIPNNRLSETRKVIDHQNLHHAHPTSIVSSQKTNNQTPTEKGLSRMMSFSLGRPISTVLSNRQEENNWHRSTAFTKQRRESRVEVEGNLTSETSSHSQVGNLVHQTKSSSLSPLGIVDSPRCNQVLVKDQNPPSTPGPNMWSRFFRSNNGASSNRHHTTRVGQA